MLSAQSEFISAMAIAPASDPETPKEEQPTFDVIPLTAEVKSAVAELGYVHPTPVQRAVFDSAARGKDLVVQARTGTGKTAAFGLPLVDRLVKRKVKAVQSLILVPTRELALQVTRELSALGKNTGISVLPIYGGAPMLRQIEGLKEGAQIVVGTPGRVLDHLRRKTLDPSKIRILVLDECDEMLSMGFLPQILEIWNQLPKELQVLLFSATVPKPVLRVADSRLREPEFITLSGDQIGALEIAHFVYISQGDKLQELLRILKSEAPESAIIFCNTRDDTQRVAVELQRAGYNADWLNADLSQKEREAVMLATREERLPFLVCTDVAARGIDISHLTHVINFDFPEATEQYVHRTGRTGRAGRMGTAISLVSPASIGNLYYLRLEYKIHPIERQLPSDRELRTRAETDTVLQLAGRFQTPRETERSLVQRLLTHEKAEAIIAGLLREHLQSAGADTPAPARAKSWRQAAAPAVPVLAPAPALPRMAQMPPAGHIPPAGSVPPAGHIPPAGSVTRPVRRSSREATSADLERPKRERPSRHASDAGPERPPTEPRESEPQGAQRPRRPTRSAASNFSEEGISYQVRDISADDLAGLEPQGTVPIEVPVVAAAAAAFTPSSPSASGGWDGPVDEAFINVGRDDGIRTSDLHQALSTAGVSQDDTAYVRIRQRHTFIGVRQGLLDQVVSGLSGQTIAQRAVEAQPARPRQARR